MGDCTAHEQPVVAPEAIERRSFEIISSLLRDMDQSGSDWHLVRRIVHTTGDPSIAALIRIHPGAVDAGVKALRSGCRIVADVKMVGAGIDRRRSAALGCEILCAVGEPPAMELAARSGTTRGAAGMRHMAARRPSATAATRPTSPRRRRP